MAVSPEQLLERAIDWARREPEVRLAVLVGSRARPEPFDALSDLDIALFTAGASPDILSAQVLESLAPVWIDCPEEYPEDGRTIRTRLVIFAGGAKIDFAFYPLDLLEKFAAALPSYWLRGYRLLVDKDGWESRLSPSPHRANHSHPGPEEFARAVDDFWYECYCVARYLKRGDLWSAKFPDYWVKRNLLVMFEWHAVAVLQRDPRWVGHRMAEWARPEDWQAAQQVFAHLDAADSWRALDAGMRLFSRLARETASALGYAYAEETDAALSAWIKDLRLAAL